MIRGGRWRRTAGWWAAGVSLVAAGCGDRAGDRAAGGEGAEAIRIVVSIPPLSGLVRAVAPEGSVVEVMIPPGTSEHGFELTPSAAAAIGKADLGVVVGLGLDGQIERMLPRRLHEPGGRGPVTFVVADAMDVESDAGAHAGHAHDHAHGEDGHHHHGAVDPHVWLDPVLVERMIPGLREAVIRAMERRAQGPIDDASRKAVEDRAGRLLAEVRAVHAEHERALGPLKGRALVTQHAAFGRLAERYGLVVAATLRPGDSLEPTPGVVAEVSRLVREKEVRAIYAEPQSAPTEARRLAEMTGARFLVLDPLGDGDWAAMMRANLAALVEGLGDPAPK